MSILGNRIQNSECNSIDDLRRIDSDKLKDLKLLAKEDVYLASDYLKFFADEFNKSYVESFILDVIVEGESAAEWRNHVIITLDYGVSLICELSTLNDLYAPLEPYAKKFGFYRVKFDSDDWKDGIAFTGAPCVLLSDHDYRAELKSPLLGVYSEDTHAERVDNIKLATARWLVNYMSKFLLDYFTTEKILSRSDILNLLEKEFPNLGDTEIRNVLILFLERELIQVKGAYSENQIPGFILDTQSANQIINNPLPPVIIL